jgi:hypothetical protein
MKTNQFFMKLLMCLTLCVSAFFCYGQRPTATAQQVEAFFETTTYVIKRDDLMNGYNQFMQQAFEKNWKLTPFEFISYEEFEEKSKDPKASFVLLTEIVFSNDKTPARYSFISILLGGDYASINEMPELCSFPLMHTETDDVEVMTVLPAIMNFLTAHVQTLRTNSKLLKDKKFAYYTKQKRNFPNKSLLLVADAQLPQFRTPEAVASVYKGAVQFVDYDDIARAIHENKDVVFHLKVASEKAMEGTRCYTIIMGANGQLYYFNMHKVTTEDKTNGIRVKDWKAFAKFTK